MLPQTLLCLLSAVLVYAQSRQQISLNAVANFTPSTLPNPPAFTLSPSSESLYLSIALCSGNTASKSPRFFVTNSSSTADDPGSDGGDDVFEIFLEEGQGVWMGTFSNGGVLAVENPGQTSFQVGLSDQGSIHEILPAFPVLGDTTSNQAIIFSAAFDAVPNQIPSYPNYTLPPGNVSVPTPPAVSPNFTLVIAPTSSALLTTLPQTGCALSAQVSSGTILNQTLWLKDEDGWRMQWIVEELTALTNYTAYVIQDGTKISGPLFFTTKSASFSCALVSSLPYCPGISYSIPLPAPAFPLTTYDSTTLPDSISTPLISSLTNFTTTLLTFACGRDFYSPLVSCADCQREYRKWLCNVSFPRCGEPSPGNPGSVTTSPADPGATGLSAFRPDNGGQLQQAVSALVPNPTAIRNSAFPALSASYSILLPCLETCNAVDRACPNFVGFRCPLKRFNAAASYGVGYVDSGSEQGGQGEGVTGTPQDRWGNIWCNAG